jgi:hypothetical protein
MTALLCLFAPSSGVFQVSTLSSGQKAQFFVKKLAGERIFFVNDARTNPTL